MKYLNKPIAYLQDIDFDSNGNLINPQIPQNKPVVIMIQAEFCGHCTTSKPAFQEFANKNKDRVFCATIQGDGKQKGESELSKNINKIHPNFRGYPSYVVYKNNKFHKIHEGGRDLDSLAKLLNSV